MAKKKDERRGRPKLPDKIRRDYTLKVRLSDNERAEIESATDEKTSVWAREVLLAAARKRNGGRGSRTPSA